MKFVLKKGFRVLPLFYPKNCIQVSGCQRLFLSSKVLDTKSSNICLKIVWLNLLITIVFFLDKIDWTFIVWKRFVYKPKSLGIRLDLSLLLMDKSHKWFPVFMESEKVGSCIPWLISKKMRAMDASGLSRTKSLRFEPCVTSPHWQRSGGILKSVTRLISVSPRHDVV